MVVALAKHPIVDDYDLSSLRRINSGAAPLSAELALECGERIGCEVVQGYGMTELSPVSHCTPPGMCKPGSVGCHRAQHRDHASSTLSTQAPLGVDEDGEVWVRGPQVMKGYLNNEAATKDTIDVTAGCTRATSATSTCDGHLYIVDRLKELIKYKGFQVAPAELEALLLTHPEIADAAVIGLPDDDSGEIPAAYVVLKPGQEPRRRDRGVRRRKGGELQAGPEAHLRRRHPEVGCRQDPPPRPARPGRHRGLTHARVEAVVTRRLQGSSTSLTGRFGLVDRS